MTSRVFDLAVIGGGVIGLARAYVAEVMACAGETPSGRPDPLMTWKALIALDAWPARACIHAFAELTPDDRQERLARSERALKAAGADFVIEDVSRLLPIVHEIARRMAP